MLDSRGLLTEVARGALVTRWLGLDRGLVANETWGDA